MRSTVLVLVVWLAGCGSTQAYQGPARPESQVAVVIPDSPRLRQWDAPLAPTPDAGGQIYMRLGDVGVGKTSDRFKVLPGTHTFTVSYREHRTPVAGRRLETKPISLSFPVQAGREYRVRGAALYPPGTHATRPADPAAGYRVRIWAEDRTEGKVVKMVEVPTASILLIED